MQDYNNSRLNYLFSIRKEYDTRFDKQISFISSGAIALSVTLIAAIGNLTLSIFIIIAWLFLIISLLSNLISLKTTVHAVDEDLRKHYSEVRENKFNKITIVLNISSVVSLIIGIAFMLIYFAL